MDTKARLRSLMNERGWTIYRLAKESDVAWTTIRNMFVRDTEPFIKESAVLLPEINSKVKKKAMCKFRTI